MVPRTCPASDLAIIDAHHTALVLLGIGTTLGVVVQAALLLPSLARSDLHLRFRWQPGHEAMRRITRLAGWTFGIVLSNQVALVVVLALADGARVPGAVSAYTYAYTFFQLPYGMIAVSVMTAVTPSLSARWAEGDLAAFRHRMAFGLRSILAIIIPSAVGMVILAHPLIDLVLGHAAETSAQADVTAATLAMFALGLPGFCTFLYMVRVLQAMQDTRTAFRIYLVENAINIVLGILLVGPLGVRGLALSVSIAYSVAAIIALSVVRSRVGGLGGDDLTTPVTRVLGASAVMGVATVLPLNVSGADSGVALLGRVVGAVVVGALSYVGAAAVLGERLARRETRGAARPPGGATPVVPQAPVAPAASPSVRLIEPGYAEPTSPDPFRDRLDSEPAEPQQRHLRPVSNSSGDLPEGPSVDGRSAGDGSGVEPVDLRPPDEEEETHGPDPGGHR